MTVDRSKCVQKESYLGRKVRSHISGRLGTIINEYVLPERSALSSDIPRIAVYVDIFCNGKIIRRFPVTSIVNGQGWSFSCRRASQEEFCSEMADSLNLSEQNAIKDIQIMRGGISKNENLETLGSYFESDDDF